MERRAVDDAAGVGLQGTPAVAAGLPVLRGSEWAGLPGSPDADPLRLEYDECLTSLTEIAREEAELAARKVRMVARCAEVARAMAPPKPSAQEQAA